MPKQDLSLGNAWAGQIQAPSKIQARGKAQALGMADLDLAGRLGAPNSPSELHSNSPAPQAEGPSYRPRDTKTSKCKLHTKIM